MSRLISLALRSGVEVEAVLKQLRGIRCPSPQWEKGGLVLSCPDAICKAVEEYLKERKEKKENPSPAPEVSLDRVDGTRSRASSEIVGMCPDCGNVLIHAEGCTVCRDRSCGYTKC